MFTLDDVAIGAAELYSKIVTIFLFIFLLAIYIACSILKMVSKICYCYPVRITDPMWMWLCWHWTSSLLLDIFHTTFARVRAKRMALGAFLFLSLSLSLSLTFFSSFYWVFVRWFKWLQLLNNIICIQMYRDLSHMFCTHNFSLNFHKSPLVSVLII